MTFKDLKANTHEISGYMLKSLIWAYVGHKCERHMIEMRYESEGKDNVEEDPEYICYDTCCCVAENWMEAIGISPDNILIKRLYYEMIIDKMKEEIEEDEEGR